MMYARHLANINSHRDLIGDRQISMPVVLIYRWGYQDAIRVISFLFVYAARRYGADRIISFKGTVRSTYTIDLRRAGNE